MRHYASRRFWQCYNSLPESVRNLADKNFQLLPEARNEYKRDGP